MAQNTFLRDLNIDVLSLPVTATTLPQISSLDTNTLISLCVISNLPLLNEAQNKLLRDITGLDAVIFDGLKEGIVIQNTNITEVLQTISNPFVSQNKSTIQNKLVGVDSNFLFSNFLPNGQIIVKNIPDDIFNCLGVSKTELLSYISSYVEVYPDKVIDELKILTAKQIEYLTSSIMTQASLNAHLNAMSLSLVSDQMIISQEQAKALNTVVTTPTTAATKLVSFPLVKATTTTTTTTTTTGIPCLLNGFDTLVEDSPYQQNNVVCQMILENHEVDTYIMQPSGSWTQLSIPSFQATLPTGPPVYLKEIGAEVLDDNLDTMSSLTDYTTLSSVSFSPFDSSIVIVGTLMTKGISGNIEPFAELIKLDLKGRTIWHKYLYADSTNYPTGIGTTITQPVIDSTGIITCALITPSTTEVGNTITLLQLNPDSTINQTKTYFVEYGWQGYPTTYPATQDSLIDESANPYSRPSICQDISGGFLLMTCLPSDTTGNNVVIIKTDASLNITSMTGLDAVRYTTNIPGKTPMISSTSTRRIGTWITADQPRYFHIIDINSSYQMSNVTRLNMWNPASSDNPGWQPKGSCVTANGNILIWGSYTYGTTPYTNRGFLMRLDTSNNILWLNTYEGLFATAGTILSAVEISDGNIYVYGVFDESSQIIPKMALLDSSGNVIWGRSFSDTTFPMNSVGSILSGEILFANNSLVVVTQMMSPYNTSKSDFVVWEVPQDGTLVSSCPFYASSTFNLDSNGPVNPTIETNGQITDFLLNGTTDYVLSAQYAYRTISSVTSPPISVLDISGYNSSVYFENQCGFDCDCSYTNNIYNNWIFSYGWFYVGNCTTGNAWAQHGYCGSPSISGCVSNYPNSIGISPLELDISNIVTVNSLYKLVFTYIGQAKTGSDCQASLTPYLGGVAGDTITFDCSSGSLQTSTQYIVAGLGTFLQFYATPNFIGQITSVSLYVADEASITGYGHTISSSDRGHVLAIERSDSTSELNQNFNLILPQANLVGDGFYFFIRTGIGVRAIVFPYVSSGRNDILVPLGTSLSAGQTYTLPENCSLLLVASVDPTLPLNISQKWNITIVGKDTYREFGNYLWSNITVPTTNLSVNNQEIPINFIWGSSTGSNGLFSLESYKTDTVSPPAIKASLFKLVISSGSQLSPISIYSQRNNVFSLNSFGDVAINGTYFGDFGISSGSGSTLNLLKITANKSQTHALQSWRIANSIERLFVDYDGALVFNGGTGTVVNTPSPTTVKFLSEYVSAGSPYTKTVLFELMFENGEKVIISDITI